MPRSSRRRVMANLFAAFALLGLGACGGGSPDSGTQDFGDTTSGRAASAAVQPKSSTVLVTALGQAAGGVGPLMSVRIDGVAATSPATVEPSSGQVLRYAFTVPVQARAGSVVDVVFTNDAMLVSGGSPEDRNLIVESISVDGGAEISSHGSQVRYDRGDGAAAFDGVDTLAGQRGMWWNGALRYTLGVADLPVLAQPAVAHSIVVVARGRYGNTAPLMRVLIDGVGSNEGTINVFARDTLARHVFTTARPLSAGSRIDVVYLNNGIETQADGSVVDRDLIVDALIIDGSVGLRPNGPNVVYDRGGLAAAFDGIDLLPGQAGMAWSGALRFTLDAASLPQPPVPGAPLSTLRKQALTRFAHQLVERLPELAQAPLRLTPGFSLPANQAAAQARTCPLGGQASVTVNGADPAFGQPWVQPFEGVIEARFGPVACRSDAVGVTGGARASYRYTRTETGTGLSYVVRTDTSLNSTLQHLQDTLDVDGLLLFTQSTASGYRLGSDREDVLVQAGLTVQDHVNKVSASFSGGAVSIGLGYQTSRSLRIQDLGFSTAGDAYVYSGVVPPGELTGVFRLTSGGSEIGVVRQTAPGVSTLIVDGIATPL